ncbi:AAA family ATPase [Streptomyces sp. cg40]|uniref:AAA family ATPase n=1 Tax=Streptomyces sp. cg40 TaxID=3419764 RepID=UPI003D058004
MAVNVQRIVIEGYKSIKRVDLGLGALTVLVGANGAGKSNFVDAFELLGRIVSGDLSLEVGLQGGAQAMLHASAKTAPDLRIRIEPVDDELMAAYVVALRPSANDELIFAREVVESPRKPRITLGEGHRESKLARGEVYRDEIVQGWSRTLGVLFSGCRVYHFQDTSRFAPVKQAGYSSDSETLHPDAGNLAAFLHRMKEQHPVDYRKVLRTIQAVAPYFRDFVLNEETSGRIRLRWQQAGADAVLPAEALSDGTLRFICLTTLLLQPYPPELLVLDEPELGLHPFAITVLAEMIRTATARSQVIVATQSVTLLDEFELSELVIAERVEGATELRRPDPEALAAWLDDYSLGDLWLKNLLGGRPTREMKRQGRE